MQPQIAALAYLPGRQALRSAGTARLASLAQQPSRTSDVEQYARSCRPNISPTAENALIFAVVSDLTQAYPYDVNMFTKWTMQLVDVQGF